MAAEDITFQADQGTPDQLPQGAASAINEQLPTETAAPPASPAEDAAAAAPAEPRFEMAAPADYKPQYAPGSEEEQALFAQSMRPGESPLAGLQQSDNTVPPQLARSLPLLVAAAQDPDAPPQLQLLVQQVLFFMNEGR